MPPKTRIDATRPLHRVIIGGIEYQRLFRDDQDHGNFIEWLGLHERN